MNLCLRDTSLKMSRVAAIILVIVSLTTTAGPASFAARTVRAASTFEYISFFGGSTGDSGASITRDRHGFLYIAGTTSSADLPTTPGVYDRTFNGALDGFVAKFSPDGRILIWSTYLGGSLNDSISRISVDDDGAVIATGVTASSDFPTTPGALQGSYGGNLDGFVTKISPNGSALQFSTYFGGSEADIARSVITHDGEAYVVGDTSSSDFPVTPGSYQPIHLLNQDPDAFVIRINSVGTKPKPR